jgi:MFS family permease
MEEHVGKLPDCCDPAKTGVRKTTIAIVKAFLAPDRTPSIEHEAFKMGLAALVILLALLGIGFFGFFRASPVILDQYGWLVAFLAIGVVLNSASVWHLRHHKPTHSTGMMVGMTVGMMTGFLVGIIIAITNGIFIGALIGLIVGFVAGSWAGKCCGLMGMLEGQMAGFMGGPMGAMTSIMMINDNYLLFIPITLVAMAIILAGLLYLVHQESGGADNAKPFKTDLLMFAALNFAFVLVLVLIMLFGPKSAFVQLTIQ